MTQIPVGYLYSDQEVTSLARQGLVIYFFVNAKLTDTKKIILSRMDAFHKRFTVKEWRQILAETIRLTGSKTLVDAANEYALSKLKEDEE